MIADVVDGGFGAGKPDLNSTSVDAEVQGVFEAIQGHVGKSTTQIFRIGRRLEHTEQKLAISMREYIVHDQFTNMYVVYASDLIDDERHVIPNFIGSETRGLNKRFEKFGCFSDDMLDYLRMEAIVLFGRQTVAILKARDAAKVPVFIMTKESPGLAPEAPPDAK